MPASFSKRTTIVVDGIEVQVTRKRQKNMYLRVRPNSEALSGASVQVSAPLRYSDARIRAFVEQRKAWIVKQTRKVQQRALERSGESSPTPEELQQWCAVVAAFTPAIIERWAPVIGVKPGKLAYRNMVSRWGSCNVKTGRICINVQLAAQPPECLEYVVVHELCHLREANHGPRFHALLDEYLPDWREAERELKGAIRR